MVRRAADVGQTGIMNCIVALGNLWGAGMGRAFATEQRDIGWMVPVGVQFIPAVAMLIMVPFCPGEREVLYNHDIECFFDRTESPRYLLSKGRREQALKNLNRLRPKHEVEAGTTLAEVDAIETMMKEEVGNYEGRWLDLFGRRYGRRTAVSHRSVFCRFASADLIDWSLALVSHVEEADSRPIIRC